MGAGPQTPILAALECWLRTCREVDLLDRGDGGDEGTSFGMPGPSQAKAGADGGVENSM